MATEKSGREPMTPPPLLAVVWFATLETVGHQPQVVKNLLLAGSLFVVYGESNSGKTFWILDLALALAAGVPWCGRRVQRGLVIYVAGEGAGSVRARVAAYRKSNPTISGGIPFAIVPQAVNFLNGESVDSLIATIREAESATGEAAALIIIDTFARSIPGGNENDAMDVGLAVSAADRIRLEVGCCVGVVHHSGKDPMKGARGSSALRAACDTEILIEGQTGTRTATVTKQRDLESGQAMPFDLVSVPLGQDEDGEEITSCVVKHLDAQERPPAAVLQLRGKAQRQFLAAMRARSAVDPARIWTLVDLRQVGREAGQSKATARSVVDALTTSPYMQPTIGGYRFTDGRVEG